MKRLLPFVILILLLIAGLCSIPFLLNPESHRKEITDSLTKLLKRPVIIGQISLGYWPPTLKLGHVGVMKDDGSTAILIDGITAPLDVKALFARQFHPTDLQFTHWSLTSTRKADGHWDIEDWFSSASGLSASKGWPVKQIQWKEGEIHWVDPYGLSQQEMVLSAVDGKWDPHAETLAITGAFSGIGAPARLTLNAKGEFFSNPTWSGDLQMIDQSNIGTLKIESKAGGWDVKGGAAKWSLSNAVAFFKFYSRGSSPAVSSPMTLDNWQLHATSNGGILTVDHTAGISNGLSEIKGTVTSSSAGLQAKLDIAVKDIPAQAIWNVTGQSLAMDGKVTGISKDFQVTFSTHALSTVKGQGYWELKDGHYKLPDTTIQKLAKAKTMMYTQKKIPDLEISGLPLSTLSAHWQAQDGIITVSDGFLASTDVKASWVGKLDAARQGLDGYVRVKIREKDPKLSRLLPPKYRSEAAHGRLQGTWQDWSLRSVPASKIPGATQSKLRKALK